MNKYLVMLPTFPNDMTYNNQSIVVRAFNEMEARMKALILTGKRYTGLVKRVYY